MWVRKCSSTESNTKLMLQLKALFCGNFFSINHLGSINILSSFHWIQLYCHKCNELVFITLRAGSWKQLSSVVTIRSSIRDVLSFKPGQDSEYPYWRPSRTITGSWKYAATTLCSGIIEAHSTLKKCCVRLSANTSIRPSRYLLILSFIKKCFFFQLQLNNAFVLRLVIRRWSSNVLI